jgi:hypothetical protein
MSVFWGEELERQGKKIESLLDGFDVGYGLVAITAGQARALGLLVSRPDPVADPAYIELVGPKRESVRRSLARQFVWIVLPGAPP